MIGPKVQSLKLTFDLSFNIDWQGRQRCVVEIIVSIIEIFSRKQRTT